MNRGLRISLLVVMVFALCVIAFAAQMNRFYNQNEPALEDVVVLASRGHQ